MRTLIWALLVTGLLSVNGALATPCDLTLATAANPRLSDPDLIHLVRQMSSPTLAIEVLAGTNLRGWKTLANKRTWTSTEWRRVSTMAFDVTHVPDPETIARRALVYDVLVDALPTGAFISLPRNEIPALDKALIAQLFKFRPAVDLRVHNKFLARIKDESRYVDTFAKVVARVFTGFDFVGGKPKSVRDFAERSVRYLASDFGQADVPTIEFVIDALERRYLGKPTLPTNDAILAALKVADAKAAAANVPISSIDTPERSTAPRESTPAVSTSVDAPVVGDVPAPDHVTPPSPPDSPRASLPKLTTETRVEADHVYLFELKPGASMSVKSLDAFVLIETSPELTKMFANARDAHEKLETWIQVLKQGRQPFGKRGYQYNPRRKIEDWPERLHAPSLPYFISVTSERRLIEGRGEALVLRLERLIRR